MCLLKTAAGVTSNVGRAVLDNGLTVLVQEATSPALLGSVTIEDVAAAGQVLRAEAATIVVAGPAGAGA